MVLLLFTLAMTAPAADAISGVPRIVDGDTIAIGDTRIRLEGIDAPETDQVCLDQNGAKWTCGIAARDHLVFRSHQRIPKSA
jgi:endonuclease YncB( thermonuclease family)